MTAPVFTGVDGRDAAPVAFSCKTGEPQPGNNGAPDFNGRYGMGISWKKVFGLGKRYAMRQARDLVRFTMIAVTINGVPTDSDELEDLLEAAFVFVASHGRPNERKVRDALGLDEVPE